MTDERRRLHWSLAVCLAGVAALMAAALLPADPSGKGLRAGLLGFGLLAAVLGGAVAAILHHTRRTLEALARGEDVIARWRVDAGAWRSFIDRESRSPSGDRPNEVLAAAVAADGGVEVIVGRGAIAVGGVLYRLPSHGTPEITFAGLREDAGAAGILELHLAHHEPPSPSSAAMAPRLTQLRIPVPPSALAPARHAAAHFNGDFGGQPDFFHGRGDGSDPEDLSVCWSCGQATHKFRTACERCGARLQSRRWSRRYGAILIVLGLVISGLVGGVLWFTVDTLLAAGFGDGSSGFSGSRRQARAALAIIAGVFAFGVTTIGYGAYQLATGRRNRKAVGAMLAIIAAIALAAALL